MLKKFKKVPTPNELILDEKCDRIFVDLLIGDSQRYSGKVSLKNMPSKEELLSGNVYQSYKRIELPKESISNIVSLWQMLPVGCANRCLFVPGYTVSFYSGSNFIKKATICWSCFSMIIQDSQGNTMNYNFNDSSSEAEELLSSLRKAFDDATST